MALLSIYDASELDQEHLSDALKDTDHRWEFISDKVSLTSLNPECEVLSVFVSSPVTKEIIDALPNLKLIACRSTGFNNIDLKAASERDITVVNVPTYGESTVAEYVFTLLLYLSRKLQNALNPTAGIAQLTGFDLRGKTIGVIGTGHIGQKTMNIARGFEMNIVAYDPFPNYELETQLNFSYVPLDELVKSSDVLTLHAPYMPSTHHMIGAEQLQNVKQGSVLINTARGELIDTAALIEALDSGRLAGVGLDVVEGEVLMHMDEEVALLRHSQIPEDLLRHGIEISTLQKMPNVVITPHNAFNTKEAIQRINNTTAQNIISFWYGDVPNKVKPPKREAGKLLLIRHAESEWNASGRWSGLRDVHLSEKGFHEAALLGIELKKMGIHVDYAYCSEQIRTRETLEGILGASQHFEVPISRDGAFNERDYGKYTGKNKWEMLEAIGQEEWEKMRRGWNQEIPGGETLKTVYERVVPAYLEKIVPKLSNGENVLLVAHGNSIRSLIKYIENIDDEHISDLEMIFGSIVEYTVDENGHILSKSSSAINSPPPHA